MPKATKKPLQISAQEALTGENADRFRQEVVCTLKKAKSGSAIALDLTAVQEIDPPGLKVVLGLAKDAVDQGWSLQIEVASPELATLLKTFGLAKVAEMKEGVPA